MSRLRGLSFYWLLRVQLPFYAGGAVFVKNLCKAASNLLNQIYL